MPSPQQNPAKVLFRSLKSIGITQSSINAVLPSWWDDSIADDPSGLAELKVLLARRLSIDPTTLFAEGKQVEFMPVVRRYKGGREDLMDKLCNATAIAGSLGRTALKFVEARPSRITADPLKLRSEILATGAPWVSLEHLLNVCWESGIPVLHATFPSSFSKFDALVTAEDGRNAIVLCRNEKSIAWLVFHLAHEIGHIACGHIGPDAMLVDEKIDIDEVTQEQEVEANGYALKLLGGTPSIELPPITRRTSSTRIASNAKQLGIAHKVLPGHIILKAGKRDDQFPLARQALNFLEEQGDARQLIYDRAVASLRAADWTDEAEEFIEKFAWTPRGPI